MTEPTREQIEKRIAQLEALVSLPEHAVGWDTDLAVYRMALRTLYAEAKLAAMTERADGLQRHFDEAAPEHNLPALLDLYAERERAATERAEKAERERDEEGRLRTEWGALYTDMVRQRDDWHEAAHAADERAAVSNGLREAAEAERDALRAKLADAERRIADRSPPTVHTTDERLDCESSSLLLLSTWARRVMMRPKNRAKGVTSESVEELIAMAREELFEASDAIHAGAPTDGILAELGDAAACIAFAMREIEKRRKA